MKAMRYLWMALTAVLLAAGCSTKVDPYRRPGGDTSDQGSGQSSQQDTPSKEVTPTENKSWKVSYGGRRQVKGDLVEVIDVNNVSAAQYLVSVINRENYSVYGGDIKAFMEYELEMNSDVIYMGAQQAILFSPFRHGTWYAFVIGLDAAGKLTGEYAYAKFIVEEEAESEAFRRWLGQWTVSDKKYSYDLTITSEEANFVYRIDGWETGKGLDMVMDKEYLEAFFEASDGSLYLVSQYVQSYDDESRDGEKVHEFFLGQIDYDGISEEMGLYIIPEEGVDLACAQMDEDGNVTLTPCQVKTQIGNDIYQGPFYCLQYFYTPNERDWYFYNQEAAAFPMTMVRKGDVPAASGIRLRRGVDGRQKALRGKVYEPRDGRTLKVVKAD